MGELRIRNVPKDLTDKFKKVEQHFKTVESTKAIEKLINQFWEDQKTISWQRKQLQILQAKIYSFMQKEKSSIDLMQHFVDLVIKAKRQSDYFIKSGQKAIKLFNSKRTTKKKGGKK